MKKHFVFVVFTLFFISGAIFPQQETSKVRIGTFDSRCVATAYGRSADFMNELDLLRKDVAKAKEDGNEELSVKDIRTTGTHEAGFNASASF